MVRVSMIAAMSENLVIGNQGIIPWHIRQDLLRFRNLTLGHVTIMGRKAFDSMADYYIKAGKPLPDRIHIVITHNPDYVLPEIQSPQKIYVKNSLEEALEFAKSIETEEIFIAGGGQIYTQGIKYANRLYLTIVKGNFPGDAYFPDYAEFKKVLKRETHTDGKYEYEFVDLEKSG